MSERPRIVILGGGPTGLGAAYRLHAYAYPDYRLYERRSYAGGLAASFTDDKGFVWDIGGHVLFSRHDTFNMAAAAVMGPDFVRHARRSSIFMDGRFIPFPLQRNLRHLPSQQCHACLEGLVRAKARHWSEPPATYHDWLIKSFGEELTTLFFEPYAKKVWVHPIDQMSCEWVSDRVADIDVERIRASIERKEDDHAWGPNATFDYPRTGGAGEVWRRMAHRVAGHLELNATCERIDARARRLVLRDGRSVSYDHLISTLPLDQLMHCLGWRRGLELAQGLVRNAVSVHGIGLKGRAPARLADTMWIYFPDANVPLYRATLLSKLAPRNVPSDEYWSILTETADMTGAEDSPHESGDIIAVLMDLRIIPSESEVVDVWSYRTSYGYPVPSLTRNAILRELLAELEALGIRSRGRFGLWRYEVSNQDHSFMQGVEAVDHILTGAPERVAKEGLSD